MAFISHWGEPLPIVHSTRHLDFRSLIFLQFYDMENSSLTKQRIAQMLERMRKALPEIRRQVVVYEENLQSGRDVESSKITIQPKNV